MGDGVHELVLIDAASGTDATKIEFTLDNHDFRGSSLPGLKCRGLGSGDSVKLYEDINSGWQLAKTLDSATISTAIRSLGKYAVDVTIGTGPVSCELNTSKSLA